MASTPMIARAVAMVRAVCASLTPPFELRRHIRSGATLSRGCPHGAGGKSPPVTTALSPTPTYTEQAERSADSPSGVQCYPGVPT